MSSFFHHRTLAGTSRLTLTGFLGNRRGYLFTTAPALPGTGPCWRLPSNSWRIDVQGDQSALLRTSQAIQRLARINRQAMQKADGRAWHMGYAGAWGVVFMAALIFLVGMLFLRSMARDLDPLNEIDMVVNSFRYGDTMRRCSMYKPPKMISALFHNINELLDHSEKGTG